MTLKATIIRQIRDEIVKGEYKAGERLKELELCRRFKVSRTPMREALIHLEMEGLLVITPNKGAIVKRFSIDDVSDLYDVLISLEGAACNLACQNITEPEILKLEEYQFLLERAAQRKNLDLLSEINLRFHTLITDITSNPYLKSVRNHIRTMSARFARFSIHNPKQIAATLEEHPKIIEAIRKQNAAMAEFAGREHMANAKKLMIEYVTQRGIEGGDDIKVENDFSR